MCGPDAGSGGISGAPGRIAEEYPALAPHKFEIVDSRGKPSKWGGGIEFYPPGERENPRPGQPTIEVFDRNLKGPMLDRAIFGDMLHHMPAVDPEFSRMRDDFGASMRPEQLQVDERHYRDARARGEGRSFPDWHRQSQLDAYVRGYLAPDERDEWRQGGAYTTDQLNILEGMRGHLKGRR